MLPLLYLIGSRRVVQTFVFYCIYNPSIYSYLIGRPDLKPGCFRPSRLEPPGQTGTEE